MKNSTVRLLVSIGFATALAIADVAAQGPVPVAGRNVNITNGGPTALSLTPPDGPVFAGDFNKKMQNEGSCAVNPQRPSHILCGYNDYKLVLDLPGLDPGIVITRDAWMGISQSIDLGNHWRTDALLGSYLDTRTMPNGTPSPLKDGYNFHAAADPTAIATPAALVHVSGIFFKSDGAKGGIAVSTFFDPGIDESNPAPFQTVRQTLITVGSDGPDKARFIDKPWMDYGPANGTCSIAVRRPDGTLGTRQVANHPIYLAWAVFTGNDPTDNNTAQYFARSLDCNQTWSQPIKISSSATNQAIALATQPETNYIYAAYRRFGDNNQTDAIMWVRSTNGGDTFITPQKIADICPFTQGTNEYKFRINTFPTIAAGPKGVYAAWSGKRRDASGACVGDALIHVSWYNGTSWSVPAVVEDPPANSLVGNHQIQPSFAYNNGHAGLIWYDFRNDLASINDVPARSSDAIEEPHAAGSAAKRHTVDVRGVIASLDATTGAPTFGPSAEISRYLTGISGTGVTGQLQFNRPGMRMFRLAPTSVPRGVPFFSDYLHLTPAGPNSAGSAPLFFASWTDTRDALSVKVPFTVNTYSAYTPSNWPAFGSTSLVDPTQPRPVCGQGPQSGVLDMNVYGAMVTKGGLLAYSPSSSKPLGSIPRTFAVVVRNTDSSPKTVTLSITNKPTGGVAVFTPENLDTLTATIPRLSSIARTVQVSAATDPPTLAKDATVTVTVTEGGLTPQTISVLLNAGADPNALFVPAETYTPDIPDTFDLNVIQAPEIDSPEIDSPEIDSRALSPEIDSPEIDSPEIDSREIANPEIDSAAITDVNYTFVNNGGGTNVFRTRYAGDLDPTLYQIQLIIRDQYGSQASNCLPNQFTTNQVAVNINNADVTTGDFDPFGKNASVVLPPGGKAIVTARIRLLKGKVDPAGALNADRIKAAFGLVVKADAKQGAIPARPTAVLDHAKPKISQPPDITVPKTSSAGAVVTFPDPAVYDRVDAVLQIPVTAPCKSASGLVSGSLFPVGTTVVTCTSTDSHTNSASVSFKVTVTIAAKGK